MAIQDQTLEQRRRLKERHPKVRTGCTTCKQRHVKCDEKRPAPCARCTKGGYKCAGYVDPPKPWVFEYNKASDDKKDSVIALDRAVTNESSETTLVQTDFVEIDPTELSQASARMQPDIKSQRITVAQAVSQMQAISRVAPSSPYKSLEEQRAFKHFIEVCVPLVNIYSDPTVWGLAIPQAAWAHPAVKHSLIAVALVNETMAIERHRPKYGYNNRALYHVNCAIRALVREKPSTEVVITAGLILQFMESINNNAKLAYVHLMSAVRISEEFKQKVARGEQVNEEQADLILNHLDPTLQVAVKFAEVVLKQSFGAQVIDQWTPEAFELKESLATRNRPDIVNSFRSIMDARNNWGVAAVKLIKLRLNIGAYATSVTDIDKPPEANTDSSNDTEGEVRTMLKVLDHCTRLSKPTHNEHDVESCMLVIHDKVLRSILKDTADSQCLEIATGASPDHDKLLEWALDSVYFGKAHENKDLKIELGIIPPLYYFATAYARCNNRLRRRATTCLRELLGGRSEGAWGGYVAGRLADEIIDLEEELVSDNTITSISDHQLEIIDNNGKELGPSITTLQPLKTKGDRELHLWLTYTVSIASIKAEPQNKTTDVTGRRRRTRKCLSWTSREIRMLPKGINEVMFQYGYQGYFSDAAENVETASALRVGRNGIPFAQ